MANGFNNPFAEAFSPLNILQQGQGFNQPGMAARTPAMNPQTPDLQSLLQQYLQQAAPRPQMPAGYQEESGNALMNLLKQAGTPGGQFEPIADIMTKRFEQETVPSIGARFRQPGTSAYPKAVDQARRQFQESMALGGAQSEQGRMQLLSQLLNQGQQVGQRQQQIGQQGVSSTGGLLNDLLKTIALQQQFQETQPSELAQRQVQFGRGEGDTQMSQGRNNLVDIAKIAALAMGVL